MFLINTFLGFFAIQLADLLTREKASKSSPQNFSFAFFWKDNRIKILVSLLLSFTIATLTYLNFEASKLISGLGTYGNLVYVIIGAVPELVVVILKQKLGVLQPKKVVLKDEEYNRK